MRTDFRSASVAPLVPCPRDRETHDDSLALTPTFAATVQSPLASGLLCGIRNKIVIPPSVALGRRGAIRRVDEPRSTLESPDDVTIGITQDHIVVDDLFAGKNDFLRSKAASRMTPKFPRMGIALFVRSLHMKNSRVGPNGANGQQIFVGKWTANRSKLAPAPKITTFDRPGRKKRQSGGRGLQSKADCKLECSSISMGWGIPSAARR